MFSNNTHNALPIFSRLLVFIATLITIKAEQLVYISKSTNCTMTFDLNVTDSSNTNFFLQKCTRAICLRNLIDGHCTNLQQYQFQKQQCFRECCGSDIFDMQQCQDFNLKRDAYEQWSSTRLTIILTCSLLGVMVATIIFAVVYLQCCSKQEKKSKSNFQSQIKWKECDFTEEKRCIQCKEEGAFIGLPCGTFYHLKCLGSNQQWKCHHCSKNIYKVKLFCPICRKRSIIIRGLTFSELDQKVSQFYNFHPQRCFEHLTEETDTERKFTLITKQ